ncbi:MAG: hypothetical protein QXZ06_03395, partial [Candidatus Jordarchaeales archaeon]
TIDSIPTTLEKLFLSIKSFYKKNQDRYENLKNFEKSITTFLQKEKITWNDFRKISIDFEEIISYIKNEMTKAIILYINFMKIITEKNFEEKISTHNSLLQKEEFKKLSFKIDTMSLFFIQPIKSNDLYSLTLIFEYSLILRDCIKELENLNYITIKNTSETHNQRHSGKPQSVHYTKCKMLKLQQEIPKTTIKRRMHSMRWKTSPHSASSNY